jgi:hypothetical protein
MADSGFDGASKCQLTSGAKVEKLSNVIPVRNLVELQDLLVLQGEPGGPVEDGASIHTVARALDKTPTEPRFAHARFEKVVVGIAVHLLEAQDVGPER